MNKIFKHGVYVYSTPKPETIEKIYNIIKDKFKNLKKLDYHVTIMYSKTIPQNDNIVLDIIYKYNNRILTANIDELTSWVGHDNKVYLVLKLKSDIFEEINNHLKSIGLTSNFETYTPHITFGIGYDFKLTKNMNDFKFDTLTKLIKFNIGSLEFNKIKAEDLDESY